MTSPPRALELSLTAADRLRLRLLGSARRVLGRGITYSGMYSSWQDASASSDGYAQADILAKVVSATGKVVRGEAAFERDSVPFTQHEYSFPVLVALLRAALDNAGRKLTVLDFGGSLGSSYYQCRSFFPDTLDLQWFVVEQEHFVARGRSEFETDRLHFCRHAAEVRARARPDMALLSSVLQYVPDPDDVLHELARTGARYLLIDRTPLWAGAEDLIVIQHVPAVIYKASYPCRILSRQRLVAGLERDWTIICEFAAADGWAVAGSACFRYGGLFLRRRP